jgi:hypothetical protein
MVPMCPASRRSSCSLLSALLLAASAARAEPPRAPPREPAVAPSDDQAELLAERAKLLFREGEFRQALPLVQRAYALTQSPRFLFNLGVLYHKLSECVPAREHFELYLQRDQTGAARQQTLSALQELRERCPEAPPAAALPQPDIVRGLPAPGPSETSVHLPDASADAARPRHEPAERSGGPAASALLLIGMGAAAGIGAALSLAAQGRAQSDIDALGRRARAEGSAWDAFEDRRRDLVGDARLHRGLSIGLGLASLALVGAGATLWIVESEEGSSVRASGAVIGYGGRF